MTNSCVLPDDIMFSCILTRVPVKSIVRFKSVCKPWLELLSAPEFVKLHQAQFSRDPKNQTPILYSYITSTTSVLNNINSNEKKQAMIVDYSYGPNSHGMYMVGCCNGLVCYGRHRHGFVLWNPATRLSKFVPLVKIWNHIITESLGFGYDAEGDDFKLVRIVFVREEEEEEEEEESNIKSTIHVVEVYSVGSDSWTRIMLDFEFEVPGNSCNLIVNGNPYWLAITSEDWFENALVYFEVTKLVFKIVPLPTSISKSSKVGFRLVDLNGRLGLIVRSMHSILSLEDWAFDESDQTWRKTHHSFGRVSEKAKVSRFLLGLRNGKILGKREDGKLFLCDPENGRVDEIVIGDAQKKYGFEVYGYTESLRQIN